MEIAENGPTLFKADRILERAINEYWKETTKNWKWHFLRTSSIGSNEKIGSKTASRLLKKGSKFPIMDE